jgi:anaerobic sulfite reductase subunit C
MTIRIVDNKWQKVGGRLMDINTKEIKKNAFRVTKERGITASRIRVPGGHLEAKYLSVIQQIAENFGNGTLHITVRQGFEIPGIKYEDMPKVNALLQPVIEDLDINQEKKGCGYSASGTRNIIACVGNRVCPYACYDTTALAGKIEKEVFPHDLHFKIALTGCPNDCAKVRMHDFGIMGMTEPKYDRDRCVSCGACVKACKKKSVGALSMVNYKVERNYEKCIGCGECAIQCPTRAWTRSKEKYYRLTLLGRTGKKNPRLGEDFIKWADEESIIKIIINTYAFVEQYIDKDAPGRKEHIGYIVDRTGFEEYKNWALKDVNLSEKAFVSQNIYWKGLHY